MKSLKEFTDEELTKILENRENETALTLAAINSEILNRLMTNGFEFHGYMRRIE